MHQKQLNPRVQIHISGSSCIVEVHNIIFSLRSSSLKDHFSDTHNGMIFLKERFEQLGRNLSEFGEWGGTWLKQVRPWKGGWSENVFFIMGLPRTQDYCLKTGHWPPKMEMKHFSFHSENYKCLELFFKAVEAKLSNICSGRCCCILITSGWKVMGAQKCRVEITVRPTMAAIKRRNRPKGYSCLLLLLIYVLIYHLTFPYIQEIFGQKCHPKRKFSGTSCKGMWDG